MDNELMFYAGIVGLPALFLLFLFLCALAAPIPPQFAQMTTNEKIEYLSEEAEKEASIPLWGALVIFVIWLLCQIIGEKVLRVVQKYLG